MRADNYSSKVVLSGIQPSGRLTLANYIGAMKNWQLMQKSYDCIFMLVDLHTITVESSASNLKERCYDFLALYLACGIDPQNSLIFVQSHVPAHTQLSWILGCHTGLGELNRMTQYKDKLNKLGTDHLGAGLLFYPVLMAADILLYNTNLVPVGHDQKQHLELTRELALRFNHKYGNVFSLPEPYIPKFGARIMSLLEPDKKMSKSDDNENNIISLLDSPEVVKKKIQRAVTDNLAHVNYDLELQPGVSNLLTIYSAVSNLDISDLISQYSGQGYKNFKNDLIEAINLFLLPVQEKYKLFRSDLNYLDNILVKGAEMANFRSQVMIKKVSEALGFIVL